MGRAPLRGGYLVERDLSVRAEHGRERDLGEVRRQRADVH
jgi:hypothetical protein